VGDNGGTNDVGDNGETNDVGDNGGTNEVGDNGGNGQNVAESEENKALDDKKVNENNDVNVRPRPRPVKDSLPTGLLNSDNRINEQNVVNNEVNSKETTEKQVSENNEVNVRPRPRPVKDSLPTGLLKNDMNRGRKRREAESEPIKNISDQLSSNNVTVTEEFVNGSDTTLATTSAVTKPMKPMISGILTSNDGMVAGGKILKHIPVIIPDDKTTPTTTTTTLSPPGELSGNSTDVNNTTDNSNDQMNSIAATTATATTTSTTTTTTTVPTTTTTTTKATATTAKTTTKLLPVNLESLFNVSESNDTIGINTDESHDITEIYKQHNSTLNIVRDKINHIIITFQEEIRGLSMVKFAYLVIAIYLFMVAVLFQCLCCKTKCTLKSLKLSSDLQNKPKIRMKIGFRIQLLTLLFFFFFLYVGMEITYGGLLLAFVVEKLGWSKTKGSLITSVFYGSFAVARGLSIFLAKCLTPSIFIITDLILTTIALIGLLICIDTNPAMLWYLNVVLGFGMASIFPSGISWAEQYIDLTGKATASFVVGSALGEMLVPAFTGFLFEQKGPMSLLYILTGSSLLSIVIYIIMQNLASNSGDKYGQFTKLQHTPLTNIEEADLEMDSVPLTPDLINYGDDHQHMDSHFDDEYQHMNGNSGGKSRKKVTFDLSARNTNASNNREVVVNKTVQSSSRQKGSILKSKGSVKRD
jgi:hypothetical protein